MRIISGSARGRKIATPRGTRVRPTSDRVKEAIFNVLTSLKGSLEGAQVLDLFAGTGNLGIEALSRGADHAVFVDSHKESAAQIKKNLEDTAFSAAAEVLLLDTVKAIAFMARKNRRFDLVFLDPPYSMSLAEKALSALADEDILEGNTVVIAETDSREQLPLKIGRLTQFDRRTYGDTAISFYSPSGEEAHG